MKKVILHCSDSNYGNSALITKWHLDRGFNTIGYHFVILNGWLCYNTYNYFFDGSIETGRPLSDDSVIEHFEIGAHVLGHNKDSVGICLIGKSGKFTENQIQSLKELLSLLFMQFSSFELLQHSDLDKSKPFCAGLSLTDFFGYGGIMHE